MPAFVRPLQMINLSLLGIMNKKIAVRWKMVYKESDER